jgi:hypothetical protein
VMVKVWHFAGRGAGNEGTSPNPSDWQLVDETAWVEWVWFLLAFDVVSIRGVVLPAALDAAPHHCRECWPLRK